MSTGLLTIDLAAIVANWQALAKIASVETAAVVKANAYGLDAGRVAQHLANAGARQFFVAATEEGVALRQALGDGPVISVFSGHMEGDTQSIADASLTPMLNSAQQMQRHFAALPNHSFGIQLDTGMNRLGMEPAEWAGLRSEIIEKGPTLLMSHLACADDPDHPMNAQQNAAFEDMTQGVSLPRSLAATGGTLLGAAYHYDMVRPGIGLYGGEPFGAAHPVVTLDIPVIQIRDVAVGETVGYGNVWTATRPSKIATIAAGYADGLIRAMGPNAKLHSDGMEVPVVGRVSMDLITVDVTALPDAPQSLQLLGAQQSVDEVASFAGTIGYEILTSLGTRYQKHWTE